LSKTGGLSILADAAGSFATGTSSMVSFRFIWGDGTPDTVVLTSTPPTAAHTYLGAGIQTVTLIVTDNAVPPRTGRTTASITVP
jgi:PKD repeat protein